jgi:hypothetical protein
VPAFPLETDAFILLKRPPAESFQSLTVFSPTDGILLALQRVSRKAASTSIALDLFDEASLRLESSNQGQTWFIKEARLITRHTTLSRSYETLRLVSALASLIARNPVPDESRSAVASLLRQALAAFASDARPDLVWFKSLYRFARDEGYPLKEQWFPTLPAADRTAVATLLNSPLSTLTAPEKCHIMYDTLSASAVARLTARLAEYLRGHTEILLD